MNCLKVWKSSNWSQISFSSFQRNQRFKNSPIFFRSISHVFGWGNSSQGQLVTKKAEIPNPTQILEKFVEQKNISLVACGEYFTVVSTEREVWFWGRKSNQSEPLIFPTKIPIYLAEEEKIQQLAAGQSHVLFLTDSGRVFVWGYGTEGQLASEKINLEIPELVGGLTNEEIVFVSCGWLHSLAISKEGKAFLWGGSHFNQLGLNTLYNIRKPECVPLEKRIISGDCGLFHSILVTECNQLIGFGRNNFGQLGLSRNKKNSVNIDHPIGSRIKAVRCGLSHNLILTEEGEVFAFGKNSEGQLGISEAEFKVSVPQKIKNLGEVEEIVCGAEHSLSIQKNGSVWAWGKGNDFQLGNGKRESSSFPIEVFHLPGNRFQLGAGFGHTILIVQS